MLPRSEYNKLNRSGMEERLKDVMFDLAYEQEALAQAFVSELSAVVDAFTHSQASSIAAMEREAKVASLIQSISVYESRGKIASLEAERALIERLLSGDS